MTDLYIDYETLSYIDLIRLGLAHYARHRSTGIHCMGYGFDDDPIKLWWADQPFPECVRKHFKSGQPVYAHNAQFEQWITEWVLAPDYNLTPPPATAWRCTMAMALASGFPAGLDKAAKAAALPYQKNPAGPRLIREYCGPDHLKTFKEGDKDLMMYYCISDVEVMRALRKCCRELTAIELEEYHLTARINDLGIPIDVEFADAAIGYGNEVADDANAKISVLTGGKMTKATQRKARDEWLLPKLTPAHMRLLVVHREGEEKISLDSDHRRYLLDCDDLDHEARELLEYIDDAGSSALKKYSVAFHQHVDGRVHNTFLWNGAGRTGRFSGKGLQPHNIRRDVFGHNQAEALIQDVIGQKELEAPAETLARLARAMIRSHKGLYWVDWSSVENRIGPWLGIGPTSEDKLDLYREGKDLYIVTAAKMFNMEEDEVDDLGRQSGKIAELSLQFGGGADALQGMAKNYGVNFEDEEAEDIVRRWRRANPWAKTTWGKYQKAINSAVLAPGEPFDVGRVTYQSDGERFLWCHLPSERLLAYPFPKWEPYWTPWDEERFGATFQTHFPPAAGEPPLRNHARGALLFQNTVQAVAADLLREALLEADDQGLKIIAHVHDEIVGEGPIEDGEILHEIMNQPVWWSEDLPIATGGVAYGKRYGK